GPAAVMAPRARRGHLLSAQHHTRTAHPRHVMVTRPPAGPAALDEPGPYEKGRMRTQQRLPNLTLTVRNGQWRGRGNHDDSLLGLVSVESLLVCRLPSGWRRRSHASWVTTPTRAASGRQPNLGHLLKVNLE